MSLASGREYLAIPGPSVMPDRVLQAMHRPAPNIYEGALAEMVPGMIAELKGLARTEGDLAFYICNGHGLWEASLANVCRRGDTVLVLATGRFGPGWGEVAARLGLTVRTLDFGTEGSVDPGRVQQALQDDYSHEIKAVLVCQTDTASSARSDIAAIRAAMDAAGHPALYMVDCIACFCCDPFEMDAWGVDVMIAASQKGLMTPPGMGMVFFGERARAARERSNLASAYWDWNPRAYPEQFYQYFYGTAPTHHLYGLREALTMIAAEGIEEIWERHRVLSGAVWAAVDRWAGGGGIRLNVPEPGERSTAVTTLVFPGGDGERLRGWLKEHTGVTLGIGLPMGKPGQYPEGSVIRIAHMGHVNSQMVMGALGSVEAGLKALGIAHTPGGVTAAAEVIAGATGAAASVAAGSCCG